MRENYFKNASRKNLLACELQEKKPKNKKFKTRSLKFR